MSILNMGLLTMIIIDCSSCESFQRSGALISTPKNSTLMIRTPQQGPAIYRNSHVIQASDILLVRQLLVAGHVHLLRSSARRLPDRNLFPSVHSEPLPRKFLPWGPTSTSGFSSGFMLEICADNFGTGGILNCLPPTPRMVV